MRHAIAALSASFLLVGSLAGALAVEPVGGGAFNVKAKVDLKTLDPASFDAALSRLAKSEGAASEVVFYDFADTLCDLLAKESEGFSAATGIKVKHVCVDGDAATQQLLAAAQSGGAPPADVFFGPNDDMRALTKAGVVANIALIKLLPNALTVDPEAGTRSRGFEHGGTVVPFHRNQTVIAYNAAQIAEPPRSLAAIFDYVKAHGLKIAVTNPTKGGSGSGFIESALLALAPECQGDLYNFGLSEDAAKAVATRCMPKVVQFFRDRRDVIDFTNGNENSIEDIANGVVAFATVWEDDLYTLAAKGMVPKTVKPLLLASGEVGDGDGLFVVAGTDKLEAALVYANFLMSDKVQIDKLEQTGSRTARTDLLTAGKIPDRLAVYLVPDAAYHQATRPRINGLVSDAAADIFVKEVIAP
jgi:ABC-type uncharacterized transport system YnjBCD substrate-binding protein